MAKSTFKYDISIGQTQEIEGLVRPLEFNIMNMRVGKHSVGTKKWWDQLFKALKKLGYRDLNDIEWSYGKPKFLRDRFSLLREQWAHSGKDNQKRKRRGKAPVFALRIKKIIDLLRQCPIERLSFVTVVCRFAKSKEEALEMVQEEGRRLEQFIRRRFDHAAFVMFPEVDLVMAKKTPVYLLPFKGWKDGIPDNQLIYKVHFHGVIHVPSMGSRKVEEAFRRTANNRRTKSYSGTNQVRSLPLKFEPGQGSMTPDVLGISGYATKKHYRPPVMMRMLEGFADWLWLTHKIYQDDSLIISGGATDGIWEYCGDCETYYRPGDGCECGPIHSIIDDFYDDDAQSNETKPAALELDHSKDHSPHDPQETEHTSNLNWGSGSGLFHWAKFVEKNIFTIAVQSQRVVVAAWNWLTRSRK